MASVVFEVAPESASLLESRAIMLDSEIVPWPVEHEHATLAEQNTAQTPVPPKQRLGSLDVFRGLTVALMILVDDAGGAFPSINHAPWTGVTLADFVMPFFLFVVGVSVALVFKRVSDKKAATKKIVSRSVKLFLLGVLLQGGYFHGRNNLTYGVDFDQIRWLGVLQRIAIGYFLAGMTEIWLAKDSMVDSPLTFVKRYYCEWLVAISLCSIYLGLVYGLYVPDWNFGVPPLSSTVSCGVRGNLGPSCNAVGLIDRLFLGEKHLYRRPVYRRTKECSVNSPDYGPLPPNAPSWCLAPFEPEGLLSSLSAAVTCFIGVHYGHMITNFKGHMEILISWFITSFLLLLLGFILNVVGVPFSKPLYTLSYLFLSSGVSGFVLTAMFYVVDVKKIKKPTILLQWMGLNALIVYALAACDLFPAAIQGFYWKSPEKNLVSVSESWFQDVFHSKNWGTLAFVLIEILFWCLIAGFLHRRGIYIKL